MSGSKGRDGASRSAKSGLGLRGVLLVLVGILVATSVGLSLLSLQFLSGQDEDAGLINAAGRQRMLSQKMTKEAFAVAAFPGNPEHRRALEESIRLFDTSHTGLIHGNDALGFAPMTNQTILAQMMRVDGIWKELRPHLQTIAGTSSDSPELARALAALETRNMNFLQEADRAVSLFEESARGKVATLKTFLLFGAVLSLGAAAVCGFVVDIRILKPIRRITEMVDDLSRGRLDTRLRLRRNDELGQVAAALDEFADTMQQEILTAFNRLSEGDFTFEAKGVIREPLAQANKELNATMHRFKEMTSQIAVEALQVSDTSQSLSQGATQQASALEEIAASMNEMSGQTRQAADGASQASALTAEARVSAERGQQQMQEMVDSMQEIDTAGQSISRIIKTIDEIAFQTNLLALNAAVEAARAGAHGKGFAVVAEEVRNLAARSATAARETAELIESAVQKTRKGTNTAGATSAALDEIVTAINKVTDLVAEIAAASREQAEGIGQVNIGLSQIDQVTQQNTASSVECAEAAQGLSGQAEELRALVERFRLSGAGAAPAIAAAAPGRKAQVAVAPSGGGAPWGGAAPAKEAAPSASQMIPLDDSEFGKY